MRTCTRPPAAAGLLAAQAAAGFPHARHAPFWAVRGRGHRTSAAPTKAHAAGLIPGLCTRGLASAYPHIYACACARGSIAAEINPKPSPGWELPAAAQGAHPAIAGHPSSRCPAGMLLCGIGLHCTCTHMRMRIRMPGRARVRRPWAQARFCWRGGSAMAPRACSPACCEKPRAGHAGAAAVAVGRCAPPHHRNKPTIHLNMIALSSLAYIRAIMNAFMFHTRRTTISWLSEQNY